MSAVNEIGAARPFEGLEWTVDPLHLALHVMAHAGVIENNYVINDPMTSVAVIEKSIEWQDECWDAFDAAYIENNVSLQGLSGFFIFNRQLVATLDSEFDWSRVYSDAEKWKAARLAKTKAEAAYRMGAAAHALVQKFRAALLSDNPPAIALTLATEFQAQVLRGAHAGGVARGIQVATQAEEWRKPFAEWAQTQHAAEVSATTEHVSWPRILDLVEKNWPQDGFADQRVKPERSTLEAALRWGMRESPQLFRKPDAQRGRKKK